MRNKKKFDGMMSKAAKAGLCLLFASGVFAAFAPARAYANVLGNGGFEEAIGSGVNRNWDNTNGASRADNATLNGAGFASAPQGSFGLIVPDGSFTFQTFDNVKPGDFVTFNALAQSTTVGAGNGSRLKIEFKEVRADGTDYLISSVTSGRANTTTAPAGLGNPYVTLTASGTAPAATERIVLVIETTGGGGTNAFDSANAEVAPVGLRVTQSKSTVQVGEPVAMQVQFQNDSGDTLTNVKLHVSLPPGFRADDASVRLNGNKADTREGSLIVSAGDIGAGQVMNIGFIIIPTSAVTIGNNYRFDLVLTNGAELSEHAVVQLVVTPDPVFEEGTIIGKVFQDDNQNGVQDEGERGIPWIKLVTEEGIIVITDEHGRYSIPAVKPGRHLVKIDGHTLPEGTKFITEETFLVKTTPGLMSKANFAVLLPPSEMPPEFGEELSVNFTQGLDTSRPDLEVDLEPKILKAGLGYLEKEGVFKFKINYPEFVKNWYIEIRDEVGTQIWTGYGVSAPPEEVTWNGQTEEGLLIKPGIYSYQLKVEDFEGHEDWTPLQFFRVLAKTDSEDKELQLPEIPAVGNFNIFKDGKSSIPLIAKPTVRIQGKTKPGYTVTINSHETPVETDGRFQTEFYVTPGEKEYLVEAKSPDGVVTSYHKTVKVKDSMFFMVALGEQQLGYNFNKGDIESAGEEGAYKSDFYEDGRMSYYLKGKLKGKYLVQSHYDTDDKRSAFFRNLDQDDYYPIYGDGSTRNYEATNTRQRFYILIEKDRSFLKWGSFQTEFNETELSTYNRTFSGLKGAYEDTKTTVYGDPKKAVKFFYAKASHEADHNELAATGGTLYYLRNRNVIEGSEKIRVEIRDKLQDITVDSYDLQEGKDYEIDYNEGRIMLSRPLSSMAASDTLISSNILDGSPVFLVIDYEFDAGPSNIEDTNRGIRAYTHMGDHFRIGATGVQEKRHLGHGRDYDLRGIDAQFKAGRNTKITAEYAEAKQQQTGQSVSYDGGLSFADLSSLRGPDTEPRENAYLIKGQTKPLKKLDVSGYLQGVEPGFSVDHLRSQEGYKKYGLATQYHITDSFYAKYRFDASNVVAQLLPLDEEPNLQVPFENRQNHIGQLGYDDGRYLGEVEYIEQRTDFPANPRNLNETLLSEFPFDRGVAVKAGYRVTDSIMPYGKFQMQMKGDNLYQLGGGVRYEVTNQIFAYLEEMFGNAGDATYFGLEKQHNSRSRSYANIRMRDRGIGEKTLSSAIGSSYSLSEKSRVFSEREYSTHQSVDGFADILGISGEMHDHWDYEARYERRHLDNSSTRLLDISAANALARTNTFNTVSGALAYADGKKLRARTYLEVRRDQDAPKLWQWVTRNSVEYHINEDLSYLGKVDFGKSRFTDPGDDVADFMELSTGFAYRPVDFDRFNMLSRYTYVRNFADDVQFTTGSFSAAETDETAHIIAVDMAYDLHRLLGVVEKIAYKRSMLDTPYSAESVLHNFLWAHRFNFHVTRKWDVAAEYRMLWQFDAAQTLKHGPLLEIDREFYEYVRMGVGYNFTDFEDDLRKSNGFTSHGPFVRMTGKF
jgi:uncharacterized repeat protein (TIGR01451 family)